MSPRAIRTLGFVGLGVMGEPMCRNLARKSGLAVVACDTRPEPLQRLKADGVRETSSAAAVAEAADLIFLSLPGSEEVRSVCLGPTGLVANAAAGQIVVDLSTCQAAVARAVAAGLAEAGVAFADAPVARTREAAAKGTLSIMVGGDADTFARIRPYLALMASDITHCGPVGAGQVVKIMNNMILMQTVIAIAEGLAIGGRAGVDGGLLLETLSKGSADSFALRNHGMKAMLPRAFPEDAFSTLYALKDLSYALELAREVGVTASGARHAETLYRTSAESGNAKKYYPAVIDVIDPPA